MVGAVVVRDGEVVGKGYHRRLGGPHAEVEALAASVGGSVEAMYYALSPSSPVLTTGGPRPVARR